MTRRAPRPSKWPRAPVAPRRPCGIDDPPSRPAPRASTGLVWHGPCLLTVPSEDSLHPLTPRQLDVARDLLAFLLRHPEALDTLDGYARWRLGEEAARRTTSDVQQVVGWLLERDLMRQVSVLGLDMFGLQIARRTLAAQTLAGLEAGER